MTDKGSQDDNDAGADAHFPTGVPRTVGGPPTGGSPASRSEPEESQPEQPSAEIPIAEEFRTEPAAGPAPYSSAATELIAEPPALGEPETQSYLPPVFDPEPEPRPAPSYADGANLPPAMSLRSETETEPATPTLGPPPPAFTSAAFDLFFPPETEVPPTYQTRGHQPYSQSSTTPSGTEAAQPLVSDRERRKAQAVEWFWKVARYAGYAAVGYLVLVLVLILLFRFVNPPASSLMLSRWLTGNSVSRTWVPIDRVSPNLIRAVIVAEDGRFCEHAGIDFQAIGQAIEQASDGAPRGASTISMQVTKNMFLWSSKSYIRKIIELPLTLVMELVWPKWRILEVYLNIAEWGPGIFGAEAASRYHFNSPAARLSERQASLLAAALPNPIVRDAGDPSSRVSRKARIIQARMRAGGAGAAACVLGRI